jgi:hypothetical protein
MIRSDWTYFEKGLVTICIGTALRYALGCTIVSFDGPQGFKNRNPRSYLCYIEEAFFKKGENFFQADLRPILCSEERFCRPLKNCSHEVNYLV